ALFDYSSDHGGKLPNAATWQSDLTPYYRKIYSKMKGKEDASNPLKNLLMAPDGDWGCSLGDGKFSGMAMNEALSNAVISKVKDSGTTIVLFEVARTGRNLHEPYTVRPKQDGPKFLAGQKRAWIEQPVQGDARAGDFNVNMQDN